MFLSKNDISFFASYINNPIEASELGSGQYITPKELEKDFGVTQDTLLHLRERAGITPYTLNHRHYYSPEQVITLVRRQAEERKPKEKKEKQKVLKSRPHTHKHLDRQQVISLYQKFSYLLTEPEKKATVLRFGIENGVVRSLNEVRQITGWKSKAAVEMREKRGLKKLQKAASSAKSTSKSEYIPHEIVSDKKQKIRQIRRRTPQEVADAIERYKDEFSPLVLLVLLLTTGATGEICSPHEVCQKLNINRNTLYCRQKKGLDRLAALEPSLFTN